MNSTLLALCLLAAPADASFSFSGPRCLVVSGQCVAVSSPAFLERFEGSTAFPRASAVSALDQTSRVSETIGALALAASLAGLLIADRLLVGDAHSFVRPLVLGVGAAGAFLIALSAGLFLGEKALAEGLVAEVAGVSR